jgi:hypothetical protein
MRRKRFVILAGAATLLSAEPVTHEARNTGTTEQHVIRVELK